MFKLLAHASEPHEEVGEASTDLLTTLGHQPIIVSLLAVAVVVLALYSLLGIFKLSPLMRLLWLVPLMIGLALFYLPHQPIMTTIILSVGFIGTFLLTFTMMAGVKK